MTNAQLQVFYDLLGEAFKAGSAYATDETKFSSAWLFPLAARMEAELTKLVEVEREACATIAEKRASYFPTGIAYAPYKELLDTANLIRRRSSSSEERNKSVGWQTIETAPKDGTKIWAYDIDGNQEVVWWHYNKHDDTEYWMNYADSDTDPTHWMPLPSSPERET